MLTHAAADNTATHQTPNTHCTHQVGSIAAHTASAVIARHGPQLDPSDARRVVLAAARALADSFSASPGAAGAALAAAAGAGLPPGRALMSVLEARALLRAEAMHAAAQGGEQGGPAAGGV